MHGACLSERDQGILQALFCGEINGGRFTGDDARENLRILGRRKLASEFRNGDGRGARGDWRHRGSRFLASRGMACLRRAAIEEKDYIAFLVKGDFEYFAGVI